MCDLIFEKRKEIHIINTKPIQLNHLSIRTAMVDSRDREWNETVIFELC